MAGMALKYLNDKPYVEYALNLKYTNEAGLPIKEIANALLALEAQIDFLPLAMNQIFKYRGIDDLRVEKTITRLTKLQSGSLIADVIIRLFFKDKKNLNRLLDEIRTKYKLDVMAEKFTVPALLLLALFFLLDSCSGKVANDSSVNIDISENNGIVIFGSEVYGIPPKDLKNILIHATRDIPMSKRKRLENMSLDIFKPIQNGRGNLEVNNDPSLSIKGADIINLPEKTTNEDSQEDIIFEKNVNIQIRALDRDNGDSGWSAIIPSISNARVKMIVPKDIDLSILASKENVVGDVYALWVKSPNGKRRLKEYTLRSIKTD